MEKILFIAFVFLTIGLWFWAILDITRSRFKSSNIRAVWFMAVLLLPVLGSIIYFQFRRKFVLKKRREFKPDFDRTSSYAAKNNLF